MVHVRTEIAEGDFAATPRASVAAAGALAALVAFVGIAAYGVVQVLQIAGTLAGPPSEALVYATSVIIAPGFLVAIIALHHTAAPARRFYSQVAMAFATLYAGFALLIYVVQLGSVMPAGPDAPAGFVVTPHSFFWTVDALAYITMGVAALFAVPVVARKEDAALRWALIAHAAMTPVITIVYFWPVFSTPLLVLGAPWLLTGLAMTGLLAARFRRLGRR